MSVIKGINGIAFIADNGPDEGYALRRTIELAREWNARVLVMDVIELGTLEGELLRNEYPDGRIQGRLVDARLEELREKTAPYADQGVEIKVKVSSGRYHHEVVRAIIKSGCRLLIKAPKGPKLDPGAIGPMDRRLIAGSPCPILLMRDIDASGVLASISLDSRHDLTLKSDKLVIEFADLAARMRRVPLHLVHAWELPDERILRAVSSAAESDHFRRRIEEAHQRLLDKFLGKHPQIDATLHLMEGWASNVVPDLVKDLDISLLVIGASRKEKADGCPLGSILEVILSHTACSILITKPA